MGILFYNNQNIFHLLGNITILNDNNELYYLKIKILRIKYYKRFINDSKPTIYINFNGENYIF